MILYRAELRENTLKYEAWEIIYSIQTLYDNGPETIAK